MFEPIWTSFLDTDIYKLTMGQFIWHYFRGVRVKFGFTCRTKINLPIYINEAMLRSQLDAARTVGITQKQLAYLKTLTRSNGKQLFSDEYLDFLKTVRLSSYELKYEHNRIALTLEGPWEIATFWEIPALQIINELYGQRCSADLPKHSTYVTGDTNLDAKIFELEKHPNVKFAEFGTRRRFSRRWENHLAGRLTAELPAGQMIGISNVEIAMLLGAKPTGTLAHELFMVVAALRSETDEGILYSQQEVLTKWEEFYGPDLLTFLPDTFGTKAGLSAMTLGQVVSWSAIREDSSGDPIAYGERIIGFYQSHGIDPSEKTLIPSDGLDLDKMILIENYFRGRIRTVFGWGTNLTNDVGISPLSIVVKVTEADGRGTVKLSDNLAKAQGTAEDIERYKRIFGYTNTRSETCTY